MISVSTLTVVYESLQGASSRLQSSGKQKPDTHFWLLGSQTGWVGDSKAWQQMAASSKATPLPKNKMAMLGRLRKGGGGNPKKKQIFERGRFFWQRPRKQKSFYHISTISLLGFGDDQDVYPPFCPNPESPPLSCRSLLSLFFLDKQLLCFHPARMFLRGSLLK